MEVDRYPNGELITQERIQDEPWYDDYQCMEEMVVRNTFNSYNELLEMFESDFIECFRRPVTAEEHERFERWARVEYDFQVEDRRLYPEFWDGTAIEPDEEDYDCERESP